MCIDLEIFCGCLEVARVHSIHALCRAHWEFQITRCLWKLHKEGGNPNWTLTEHQFWFEQNCVNVFFLDWLELFKLLNLIMVGRRNENGGFSFIVLQVIYICGLWGGEVSWCQEAPHLIIPSWAASNHPEEILQKWGDSCATMPHTATR